MQNKIWLAAVLSLLCVSAFAFVVLGGWEVKDDSYSIAFSTKGATGVIKGLKGVIRFDESDLASSGFDVTVDVNTLNTGNGLKNHHAKGDGFLDAKKYPTIHFVSSEFHKTASGYQVDGKLTIKDVTNNVSIPFVFERSGVDGSFKGRFAVSRSDYHLNHGGVGEVVDLELNIPVKKAI